MQWSKYQRIEGLKKCRVDPNAQGEREHGDSGEDWVLPQLAEGEFEIIHGGELSWDRDSRSGGRVPKTRTIRPASTRRHAGGAGGFPFYGSWWPATLHRCWIASGDSAANVPSQRRIVTWWNTACSGSGDAAANTASRSEMGFTHPANGTYMDWFTRSGN